MSRAVRALANLSRAVRGRAASRVLLCLAGLLAGGSSVRAQAPVTIKVVGGLAGVSQYTRLEEPFWRAELGARSGGRIVATVHPFDRSGLHGQEMLTLMRLGVVPFGTIPPSIVAGEEPELSAADLPALNPDLPTLRRTVGAYRAHVARILRERHGIRLLAVYAYPAQVIYCAKPFHGFGDLRGRRVRTSSVNQAELMTALGAMPVITRFDETVAAVRDGVVDCAVTGTLSGHEIGLGAVTTHVHAMAISWGVSLFAANESAWAALPPDLREILAAGVQDLEARVWDAADRETRGGLACITGGDCASERASRLTLVGATAADEALRRRLLTEAVLPRWIERCGTECATAWNSTLAPVTGVTAPSE